MNKEILQISMMEEEEKQNENLLKTGHFMSTDSEGSVHVKYTKL